MSLELKLSEDEGKFYFGKRIDFRLPPSGFHWQEMTLPT